jgi:2-polyprenyl-3-methyl-5-hydroxy-6-metoxy-1,4-benzoquinol methylase
MKMESTVHKDPTSIYYNMLKSYIIQAIPDGSNVILDLGCASGQLGKELRRMHKLKELVGVELFAPAARQAAAYYDVIHEGDVEELELPYIEYFDFVVCSDILEHLRDPWSVINKINRYMKTGGILITVVPNLRYWRILRDLVLSGNFEYADAGILDKTHLRFFTKASFLNILEDNNYKVILKDMVIDGPKQSIFNKFTLGLFEDFLGSQIYVKAKKFK